MKNFMGSNHSKKSLQSLPSSLESSSTSNRRNSFDSKNSQLNKIIMYSISIGKINNTIINLIIDDYINVNCNLHVSHSKLWDELDYSNNNRENVLMFELVKYFIKNCNCEALKSLTNNEIFNKCGIRLCSKGSGWRNSYEFIAECAFQCDDTLKMLEFLDSIGYLQGIHFLKCAKKYDNNTILNYLMTLPQFNF
jgi:hypothetical protein